MSRSATPIAAAALTIVLIACSGGTLPTYRGNVKDATSERPVAGAVVIHTVTFSCPQLRLTDGQTRSQPGPCQETRTDALGNFALTPGDARITWKCQVGRLTSIFSPGYFPAQFKGNPALIHLQPMTHYLDYLPWRYPREYLPTRIGIVDAVRHRLWHRRLRAYQGRYEFSSLGRHSSRMSWLRKELNSRQLIFLDDPGSFWHRKAARFDRGISLANGSGVLLHCAASHTWFHLSKQGKSRANVPELPAESAILPDVLPLKRGFVFVNSQRIHVPRSPAAPAAPFEPPRYLVSTCRYPDVIAVAPWGSGAAVLEDQGGRLCLYARKNGALLPPRVIVPPSLDGGHGDPTFTRLIQSPASDLLALVRHGGMWSVLPIPGPDSGQPPGRATPLPVEQRVTAAAWGDGLVLGLADGSLRHWMISQRESTIKINRDNAFDESSRGVLPGPPTSLASFPNHCFVAVCGGEKVYRFGILGIPDRAVRLGGKIGGRQITGSENMNGAKEMLKATPPRIHSRAGSVKAHPAGKRRHNRKP